VNQLVRAARPADAEAIGRIHSESWRLTYAGLVSSRYLATLDDDLLAERWRQRLSGPRGESSLLVAEQAGDVIGFALFGPSGDRDLDDGFAGEVQMLYVLPAGQRRGHGRALFERAAADLAARRASGATAPSIRGPDGPRSHARFARFYWLVVWVVEQNLAARAFYRRLGLLPDGAQRTDMLGGQAVPVVRYAAPLNPLIDFARLT